MADRTQIVNNTPPINISNLSQTHNTPTNLIFSKRKSIPARNESQAKQEKQFTHPIKRPRCLYASSHSVDFPKQTFEVKNKSTRNQAGMHDIGITWHYCRICEKKITLAANLKRHHREIHGINMEWHHWHHCYVCDKQFKRAEKLRMHCFSIQHIRHMLRLQAQLQANCNIDTAPHTRL